MKSPAQAKTEDLTKAYELLGVFVDAKSSKQTKAKVQKELKNLIKESPQKKMLHSSIISLDKQNQECLKNLKTLNKLFASLAKIIEPGNLDNQELYKEPITLLDNLQTDSIPPELRSKALKNLLKIQEKIAVSQQQAKEIDEKWHLDYLLGEFSKEFIEGTSSTGDLLLELGRSALFTTHDNFEGMQEQKFVQAQNNITNKLLRTWLSQNSSEDFKNSICKDLIKEQKEEAKKYGNHHGLNASLLIHAVTERFKDTMPLETKIQSLIFISRMLHHDHYSPFAKKVLQSPKIRNALYQKIKQALGESSSANNQVDLLAGKIALEQPPYELDAESLRSTPPELKSEYMQILSLLLCPSAQINDTRCILHKLKQDPSFKEEVHRNISEELQKANNPIAKLNLLTGKVFLELEPLERGKIAEELGSEENYRLFNQLMSKTRNIALDAKNLLQTVINQTYAHNRAKTLLKHFLL